MDLPDKKYKLIYADPPWSYDNKKMFGKFRNKKGFVNGGCESKYPTMDLNELISLDINKISMKDCILFLWGTTPMLPEAFELLISWGFKYKTAIYWRKIMSLGMGFWFRGQVELCLLGVKGNIRAFHSQKPNFIQTKVREHSKKPDQIYGMIEELGFEPKIELFEGQKPQISRRIKKFHEKTIRQPFLEITHKRNFKGTVVKGIIKRDFLSLNVPILHLEVSEFLSKRFPEIAVHLIRDLLGEIERPNNK